MAPARSFLCAARAGRASDGASLRASRWLRGVLHDLLGDVIGCDLPRETSQAMGPIGEFLLWEWTNGLEASKEAEDGLRNEANVV